MTSAFNNFLAAASGCWTGTGIGSNGVEIDFGVVAAGGAVFAPRSFERPEGHGQRVVNQQTAHERLPNSEQQLHGFGRLDQPHNSGEHTQHTRFVAGADRDFQFAVEGDMEKNSSAAENALIRSRWLSTGAGRSDAMLSGGDLADLEVTATECWDAQFGRTFYSDSVTWQPTEGDAGSCAFADVALPEF